MAGQEIEMSLTAGQSRTYRLEHEGIRSLMLHYTMPALVGTMVVALYNVVDRIFIGHSVGDYGIAGLALTFPMMIFLQAFGMLVGAGASTRISILLGEKNHEGAERILGQAILLTLLLQVVTIVPALIWLEPLLRLFGGSERTIPYAMEYLYITVPGNVFATLAMSYNAVMRASGYPNKAMYTMLIGAVLNIVLDAIFINVCGWGIAGAAWATVLSMMVSAIFVLHHFVQQGSVVCFRRRHLVWSWSSMVAITSIGISPFTVQLLGSLSNILINRGFQAVAPTSEAADHAIGALGVINGYAMVGFMMMIGIAQGMQPIVGYNHGAGLQHRVRKALLVATGANTLIGIFFTVLALIFTRQICGIFTDNGALFDASVNALGLCIYCFVFVGTQIVATQFFQSIGQARKAFWLSISRQALFLIPLLLVLPLFLAVDGVWISLPLADALSGLVGLWYLYLHLRQIQ